MIVMMVMVRLLGRLLGRCKLRLPHSNDYDDDDYGCDTDDDGDGDDDDGSTRYMETKEKLASCMGRYSIV